MWVPNAWLAQCATLLMVVPQLVSGANVPNNGKCSTASTHEYCLTQQGTRPVWHVPTTTVTSKSTITRTTTSTKTPTTTVHPGTPTHTVVGTTTVTSTRTAAQPTDTTTVVTTSTSSSTVTTTSTSTSTSTVIIATSTTITSTSTVPTASGFTPIASVPSVQQGGGGSQEPPPTKRDASAAKGHKAPARLSTDKEQCPKTFPQKVTCYKHIEVVCSTTVTITGTKTSTVTAPTPHPVTTTTTVTSTTSTTVTPAATTVTASSTVTTVDTTTSTTTSTATSITTSTSTSTSVSVTTAYAACASNNVIDAVNNMFVSEVHASTAFSGTNDGDMSDPVACCNICQVTGNCAGWFIANPGGFYDCTTIPSNGGSCSPDASPWGFHTATTFSESFYVGNGPCGEGTYNGVSS